MATAVSAPVEGIERVVQVGGASYWDTRMARVFARYGAVIRVHPDHIEEFDRTHGAAVASTRFRPDPEVMRGGIVDVSTMGAARPRPPTAVEQRIMQGFGDGGAPVTEQAMTAVLAADEAERDAARAVQGAGNPGPRRR